jgi:hypothetical protein
VDTLHRVYQLTVAEKGNLLGVARLVDVYKNLTLLPSARRAYSLQEFARDLYLLDESSITKTTSGHRFRLHPGATGSKSPAQLLLVVDRAGFKRTYYGIEFFVGQSQ